jgi:hypothetical protein
VQFGAVSEGPQNFTVVGSSAGPVLAESLLNTVRVWVWFSEPELESGEAVGAAGTIGVKVLVAV